jgi:hypothetical protein
MWSKDGPLPQEFPAHQIPDQVKKEQLRFKYAEFAGSDNIFTCLILLCLIIVKGFRRRDDEEAMRRSPEEQQSDVEVVLRSYLISR